MLHEIAPAATLIGYLSDPTTTATNKFLARDAEKAARVLGVRLAIANASTRSEIDRAFAALVEQRIGALPVGGDPLFDYNRAQIAALAARHAVPAIYATRDGVEAGGLMSYGASISDAVRLAGNTEVNVDAWPDDVPVPSFGPRMRCTKCGKLGATAIPNWVERRDSEPGGRSYRPL